MESMAVRWMIKGLVPVLTIPLVFLFQQTSLGRLRRLHPVFAVALGILAIVSVGSYFEFGYLRYGRYMNPHDVFHYYIGAKYSAEVDYADLYRCALVADMEGKRVFKGRAIRNLDTHGFESTQPVLTNAAKYKSTFTPQRWEEFKKDIRYFQSAMPAAKWNQVLGDKGYNATPVWNTVARFLTNHVSTDSVWGMRLLVLIDPFLMAIMYGAVWWAFGWRAALLAMVYFDTNFMGAFVHIKGAFLRLDWVVFLVVSTCLIKRGWYKSAGVLMAYSAMARVFPAIFLFGLGLKAAWSGGQYALACVKTQRLTMPGPELRRYIAFFLAVVIASVIFVGIATWDDGGLHRWESFSKKIAVHNNDISTTRVGFKYIFLSPFAAFGEKAAGFRDHQALWRFLMLIALALAAIPVLKLEDAETIPYSFVPAFFLTAPTFYYYVMLVVPLLLFLPKIERWPRSVGLASMYGISAVSCYMNKYWPLDFRLCLFMSSLLFGLVLYMMAVPFLTRRAAATAPEAPLEPEPELKPAPLAGSGGRKKSKRKGKAKTYTAPQPQPAAHTAYLPTDPAARSLRPYWIWGAAGLLAVVCVGLIALFVSARRSVPAAASVGQSTNDVQLMFAGDVMLSRNVAASIKKHGNDFSFPFQKTADYTRQADIAFCNLECPVTERGDLVSKHYTFRAEPQALTALRAAGFQLVSIANNHVLDYGPDGLSDTLSALAQNQIHYVGICTNDEPQTPVIMEAKGLKIGYLGYADPAYEYSYAKEFLRFPTRPAKGDRETIQADIARLKPQVDLVVVSIHWGIEYRTDADVKQRELGRFIIDSGASIVAGHHPHVLQDPELYHNGLIIYSLGNFVFDQHTRPATRLSRLFRVFVNKQGMVRADFLPLEIANLDWQPTPTATDFVPVSNQAPQGSQAPDTPDAPEESG